MAYYMGRTLAAIRLYEEAHTYRGDAAIYPGEDGEAEILAAGRVCAEAFSFAQERSDYSIDFSRLETLLSEGISDDADDSVLESLEQRVRDTVAHLFQQPDFRAAAQALAERLFEIGSIDDGETAAAIIRQHLAPRGIRQ